MAKKPKLDVTGLSVDDILNMDVNKLSERNLRSVTTRLVSASNKRTRRLEKSDIGLNSPAYRSLKKSGRTRFSVKGLNRNELLHEYARMKKYLNLKTSTISGFKRINRKFLKAGFGKNELSKFWEIYRKLESEYGGNIKQFYDSHNVQKILIDEVNNGGSDDDILQRMNDILEEEYLKTQEMEEDLSSSNLWSDLMDDIE